MKKIFDHQFGLMCKYHQVEFANGYTPPAPGPVDLQSRAGQDRLRQFAWWVVEECVEARSADARDRPEELSDILHFMTELCILSDVNPLSLAEIELMWSTMDPRPEHDLHDVVHFVGRAMNLLKAKPWKQSPKPTDPENYQFFIKMAMGSLIGVIKNEGHCPKKLYFHKNEINHSRIQSGY